MSQRRTVTPTASSSALSRTGCARSAVMPRRRSVTACAAPRSFLAWLAARGKQLKSVRIADVDGAIEAKKARIQCSRETIRGYAARLRAFVRFAEDRGWCTPGIAAGILPGRFYRGEKVRSTLSRVDIQRLLATTEGDRPVAKRDRAILMLLIVLRPCVPGRFAAYSSTTWTGKTKRCGCTARRPGAPISIRSPKPLDRPLFGTFSRSVPRVLKGLCSSRSRHRFGG